MEPFEGCDDDFYDSLLLLNDKPYGGDVLDLSNSPFEECLGTYPRELKVAYSFLHSHIQ